MCSVSDKCNQDTIGISINQRDKASRLSGQQISQSSLTLNLMGWQTSIGKAPWQPCKKKTCGIQTSQQLISLMASDFLLPSHARKIDQRVLQTGQSPLNNASIRCSLTVVKMKQTDLTIMTSSPAASWAFRLVFLLQVGIWQMWAEWSPLTSPVHGPNSNSHLHVGVVQAGLLHAGSREGSSAGPK